MMTVLVLGFNLTLVHGFQGSQISDPLASKAVMIDGKWTAPDEWSDAVVTVLVKFQTQNATGYLYSKHDASSFYFLVDFVSATSLYSASDFASITVDPLHNGGNTPQSDDRRFDSKYPSGGAMSIGTGASDWNRGNPLPSGVNIAMSMSGSPNLAQPHQITEFQIPFSIFPEMQNTVGFRATAGYYSNSGLTAAEWPEDSSGPTPATWGELTVSPTPIPEFEGVWLMLIFATTILTALVMSRKRNPSNAR